jgi:hypothetical protein
MLRRRSPDGAGRGASGQTTSTAFDCAMQLGGELGPAPPTELRRQSAMLGTNRRSPECTVPIV